MRDENIAAAWRSVMRENPGAEAVADAGRRWSRRTVDEAARRVLGHLTADGAAEGNRVALLCNNRVEVAAVLLACAYGGFIYTPLNILAGLPWLAAVMANAEPCVLLYDDDYLQVAQSLAEGGKLRIRPIDEVVSGPEATSLAPDPLPESPYLLLYTSGTTGNPKGVLLSHRNVAVNAANLQEFFEFDHTSVAGLVLPHCFTGGLNCSVIPCLLAGGRVYFEPATGNASQILDCVGRESITHMQLVPTQIFRLLDQLGRGTPVPPSLRTVGYGSGSMPPERLKVGLELLGPLFVQSYGLTECTATATCLRKAQHVVATPVDQRRLASAGTPLRGVEVRVVGEDGAVLPPGEDGEVVIRGAINMLGYWRNPLATAAVLRDGWLHSGDIGRFDADGFLYIVDRKVDLINTGGLKVVPSVVEAVLFQHPAVLEAAVVGAPDSEWGEVVVAHVVLRVGLHATEAELNALCRTHLAPYERPKRIVFGSELPKNPNGKILRRHLHGRA